VKLTELARDVERFTSHLGSGWFDVFLLANKMRLVLHDVVQHWHWLLIRELLHQIVRSGKDSIATILGHSRYMLLDVRGVSHLVPDFPRGIDLDRNVGNSSSEDLGQEVSSFGKNSIPFQNLKKAVDSEERMDRSKLPLQRGEFSRREGRLRGWFCYNIGAANIGGDFR
jgi:hypothetical protein